MKRNLLLAAAAALSFSAAPASAQSVTITQGSTFGIPNSNDFKAALNALGFTQYTGAGAGLSLSGPATLSFYFLGTESGASDSFTGGSAVFNEVGSTNINNFAGGGTFFGSDTFGGGSLANLLNFTSSLGAANGATVGGAAFGIFLPANLSGLTEFYIGFDDQLSPSPDDDNHDDLIIRVSVSAVPEPATWAMMIGGFGLVGAAMRRRASGQRMITA